jgi:hypothetical protein
MIDIQKAGEILERARRVAIEYYELTGKPLAITGEVGEYLAAKTLGLQGRKIQIKARCIPCDGKLDGQRLGSILFEHQWDCVMLVLLDERFEPLAIFEAGRQPLESALTKPGSKARNERGALTVSKFKSIGRQIWRADSASAQPMQA